MVDGDIVTEEDWDQAARTAIEMCIKNSKPARLSPRGPEGGFTTDNVWAILAAMIEGTQLENVLSAKGKPLDARRLGNIINEFSEAGRIIDSGMMRPSSNKERRKRNHGRKQSVWTGISEDLDKHCPSCTCNW